MTTKQEREALLERPGGGRSLGCSMFVVYFAVFVDMLGFGLIMPSLPAVAELTFGATDLMIGVITAAFSIAQMFGSVVCGILSDKWGRRPILTFCLLGSAISLVGMALLTTFKPNLILFILLRAAGGAMSATVGIAQAYIADCSKPSDRAKYMGMVGAASGFGVVAGPVLGPALSNMYAHIYGKGKDGENLNGFIFICYVGAGISLLNFLLALAFLHEAPKTLKRKSEVALKGGTPNAMAVMRRDLNIVLVFLGFMLAQFGFTTFQTLFVLYVTQNKSTHGKYNFSDDKIGMVFALFGGAMILTQMIATAPLSRLLGDKWATISGSFLRGVGLAALPFVDSDTGPPVHENWMIACVMAIAVSGSLVNPCLSAIVANFSDRRTQGTILGINQMFGAFARAAAPIIAALVYTWDQTSAWTYFGGVSCGLCCLVLVPLRVPMNTDVKSRLTSLVQAAAEDPEDGTKQIYAYGEGAAPRGDDHVEGYDFETDTEDNASMQDFTHEARYDPHSPPSD